MKPGEIEVGKTYIGWTLEDAVDLCRKIEAIAPDFGAHVALTGGTLYKDGIRKDCDILFYCIRQIDTIEEERLLAALIADVGLNIGNKFGWVTKATYNGKSVDLFFPEDNPSSSKNAINGTYGLK